MELTAFWTCELRRLLLSEMLLKGWPEQKHAVGALKKKTSLALNVVWT